MSHNTQQRSGSRAIFLGACIAVAALTSCTEDGVVEELNNAVPERTEQVPKAPAGQASWNIRQNVKV